MLAQLATVHESIESRGGAVIGIAPAAPYQADHLMDSSIPYDLFLDPEQRVSERVGVPKQSMARYLFNISAWWRYAKALLSGNWQRRITGHYSNLPGIVVVNSSCEVTFAHRGSGLGDYPSLESVIAELHSETDNLERG
jgi:hypothetical protein